MKTNFGMPRIYDIPRKGNSQILDPDSALLLVSFRDVG